ncbi:putative uncharacterized protein COL25A1-DT, partial [Plecturocebus cupreus]
MLLLNQTLMDTDKQAALQASERFGDELCITYSIREGGKYYPTGREAIPSVINQRFAENPTAFSARLRKALVKHASLSPDSVKGQLILKDKFITRASPDIRRKLQKQALGPENTLKNLLK